MYILFLLQQKKKKWMGNRNKAATSGKYLMTNRITPRNGVGSTENKKKKEKVKNYYPRPKPMLAPCERIFPRRWGPNSSERGLDYFLAAFGTNEIRRITRPMYNKLRGRTTETAPREMMRTERNGHGVEISTRDRREFNLKKQTHCDSNMCGEEANKGRRRWWIALCNRSYSQNAWPV